MGGKIASVKASSGARDVVEAEGEGNVVVDCEGMFLCPGLVSDRGIELRSEVAKQILWICGPRSTAMSIRFVSPERKRRCGRLLGAHLDVLTATPGTASHIETLKYTPKDALHMRATYVLKGAFVDETRRRVAPSFFSSPPRS